MESSGMNRNYSSSFWALCYIRIIIHRWVNWAGTGILLESWGRHNIVKPVLWESNPLEKDHDEGRESVLFHCPACLSPGPWPTVNAPSLPSSLMGSSGGLWERSSSVLNRRDSALLVWNSFRWVDLTLPILILWCTAECCRIASVSALFPV